MAITPELLAKANLKEWPEEQVRKLEEQFRQFIATGKFDEAEKLGNQFPPCARALNTGKKLFGIEYLIGQGVNLSRAVKEYGYEWLTD